MHERFRISNLDDLRLESARLGTPLPIQEDLSPLFQKLRLKTGHVLRNRFVVQPMEGADADANGAPGPLTFRRYTRFAAGGSALIWFEACAVVFDGRSNPHQLWIHEGNIGIFEKLVQETKRAGKTVFGQGTPVVCILQLTHAGRYAKPQGQPAPVLPHRSPELDRRQGLSAETPLVTDDYLDRLQDKFVEAARLAASSGFDGVDIKCCHGYLFSELLAAFTRENSRYGGSFENRTRLLRETISRVAQEVRDMVVTTRLGVYDTLPFPYGFGVSQEDPTVPDLQEPLLLIDMLKTAGIPLLHHSIGNPYVAPHFGRPYDSPIKSSPLPDEHPLTGVSRFLSLTRQIQMANEDLPVIGSAYSWLRQFAPQVGAAVLSERGASLIGQGRNAFAYPDSIRDLEQNGAFNADKVCTTCSGCSELLRAGKPAGCIVRDSEYYARR